MYDNINDTPYVCVGNPYTMGYKYAGYTVGRICKGDISTAMKYYFNRLLGGIICDFNVDTGVPNGNGIWGVTPNYRRDVIVTFVNGIIGTDENCMYNPQQAVTRAEAAAIILRLSDKNERLFSIDDYDATETYLDNVMINANKIAENKTANEISIRMEKYETSH